MLVARRGWWEAVVKGQVSSSCCCSQRVRGGEKGVKVEEMKVLAAENRHKISSKLAVV